MKEIKIKSNTRYFAIKKTLIASIDYFKKKKSKDNVYIVAEFNDSEYIELTVFRSTIINYLGYDFRQKKIRYAKEQLPTGKLYHKAQILLLYAKCIEDSIPEVN